MPSLSPVTLSQDWSLIYDATASGDFVGGLNLIGGGYAVIRIATSIPSASASGWQVVGSTALELSQANGDKLYGRTFNGTSVVQLDTGQFPDSFPPGVFTGLRAITVQPYTEANVKNGVQYYLRAAYPLLAQIPTGQSRRIWFKTGAKKVLAKTREFSYIAEEIKLELFVGPTGVAGGTNLTIANYNGISPVATTVQAKKDVTVTTNGTPIDSSDAEHYFGSNSAPQRVASSIPTGRERVLPANTEFLVLITNTGSGDARVQYFLDWYEGDTDLPRAE